MFCKARGLAVLFEISVVALLVAMLSAIAWIAFFVDDHNAIEFIAGTSLAAAFVYSITKIKSHPYQYSTKSKFKFESAEQVIERCIRHLHDIIIPLVCAIAIVLVFSLFYIVWFQAQIIGGFFEWIDK